MSNNSITIIIPTLNRLKDLTRSIRSLANCASEAQCEVIVVDQSDTPSDIFEKEPLPHGWTGVYIHRTQKNVSLARNLGIILSQSDLLLFLDDDVEIKPGFLSTHLELHTNPWVSASTTLILSPQSEKPVSDLDKSIRSDVPQECFEAARKLGARIVGFAPSCNLCVKKDIFKKIGLFHPYLPLFEDSELSYRLNINNCYLFQAQKPLLIHHHSSQGGTRDGAKKFFDVPNTRRLEYAVSTILRRLIFDNKLPSLFKEPDFYIGVMKWTFLNKRSLAPTKLIPRMGLFFKAFTQAQNIYASNLDLSWQSYSQQFAQELSQAQRKDF